MQEGKLSDYILYIYTNIRKRPFRVRIKNADRELVRKTWQHIRKGGIIIGDYDHYGMYLAPDNIKYFRWSTTFFKFTRIFNFIGVIDESTENTQT